MKNNVCFACLASFAQRTLIPWIFWLFISEISTGRPRWNSASQIKVLEHKPVLLKIIIALLTLVDSLFFKLNRILLNWEYTYQTKLTSLSIALLRKRSYFVKKKKVSTLLLEEECQMRTFSLIWPIAEDFLLPFPLRAFSYGPVNRAAFVTR